MNIPALLEKNFRYFSYFYKHLGNKIFVALVISVFVGVLDGFGLAMMLPLLQVVGDVGGEGFGDLGKMAFLVEFIQGMGIELTISSVLGAMLVLFILKGIAKFYEVMYHVRLKYFFVRKLRFENIDALTDLEYKAFVSSDSGRIQNTLSGEVGRIVSAYVRYFLVMQNVVMVMVYMTLALIANAQFAIMVGLGGVLTNLLFRSIYKDSKVQSRLITDSSHGFQGLLIQKVAFFKYLKASSGIRTYAERLKKKALEIEVSNRKVGFLGALMESSREPLIMLVVIVSIFFQLNFMGQGFGLILLSLLFLYRGLNYLMTLQVQWNAFLVNCGSIENMQLFMSELLENEELYGEGKFESFDREIELKDVSFNYAEENILSSVSLKIKKNETVAIVGESGSGKTTLLNILSGILKPSQGKMIVDGVDISELDVRQFQKRIGYISQDPVIFSDTLYNNVTFWSDRNEQNLKHFWDTLEKAAIKDFVESLPDKENSELGSNGIRISGGQKQRISIARELYKDVDVLILDEATSALDSETERIIQFNIDALKGAYTFIIVAHRLSTVKHADKIILMNKGKVEEVGAFDELIQNSTAFKRMVEAQEI